jgi:hypothetical protein
MKNRNLFRFVPPYRKHNLDKKFYPFLVTFILGLGVQTYDYGMCSLHLLLIISFLWYLASYTSSSKSEQ